VTGRILAFNPSIDGAALVIKARWLQKKFPNVKFEVDPATLRHPTLAFLREYWDSKRGGRPVPARADIKASELKEHLPWIVMVDVLPGMTDFRYRLVGTLVTEYFRTDPTGKTVTEAWAEQGKEGIEGNLAIFRQVAQSRLPFFLCGESDWNTIGLEEFQCLLLPLSDDGENVNVILHAFVFDRRPVLLARQIARNNQAKFLAVSRHPADGD
jgi:hypothetical protein